MKSLCYILFSLILVTSVSNSNTVEAQSLMQTAKRAEQRAKELKKQETSRFNAIIDSKDLNKYNQYIADYPTGSKTQEIRNRADELKLWDKAKSSNTVAGYESYLSSTKYHWYDNVAKGSIRALKQKAEKQVWDKVVALNTINAYEQYLQQNPNSGYRQDAENAINRLRGAIEWQKIKGANNIDELQLFIFTYPDAAEVNEATSRLHELKGIQHYNEGNFGGAYNEFSQISRDNLSYGNRKAYDDVMEYHEFTGLGKNSTVTSLLVFMKKYPDSKYSDQVSNMLAIAKARSLGEYASSYDYNQALSYAKDSFTRKSVQSYISMNKKKQKDRRNALKSWEREQNGGTVNIGLDFMDWGYNYELGGVPIMYYNIGLLFRIGNYRDRVQFAFGLKPGLIGYDDISYVSGDYFPYEISELQTAFHMPIIGQLKFNLFNTSENSRFYIYGQYQYNAVRVEDVETEMSWCAGLGIGWKHVDWSFYYRKDIGRLHSQSWDYDKQKYIAMSLIYYWQI